MPSRVYYTKSRAVSNSIQYHAVPIRVRIYPTDTNSSNFIHTTLEAHRTLKNKIIKQKATKANYKRDLYSSVLSFILKTTNFTESWWHKPNELVPAFTFNTHTANEIVSIDRSYGILPRFFFCFYCHYVNSLTAPAFFLRYFAETSRFPAKKV